MPHPTSDDTLIDNTEPFTSGARLGWWGGYVLLVLMAFCFGVWTGNQRPRPVEQAAAPAPVEKGEPTPEPKKELTPEPKKAPEPKLPEPKKTPEVVTPEPKKTPEVVTPEPKKTPEVVPPEPKTSPMVKEVLFVKDVQSIFKSKCTICHGDTKGPKADLDLRSLVSITKGGDGGPGVKGGDLKGGTIWATIEDMTMPPPGKEQLTDAEKAVIRNWILSGAK
jgi:hypothetical protein